VDGRLALEMVSNHQAVSDRVLDDFRIILHAELFQDAGAISADCLGAE
jgi:hypothetical protein